MCSDDIECEAVWADTGGGGDIDSGIPTWIRLGGRGGGPICPFPDSWWAIAAIGFATISQLTTPHHHRELSPRVHAHRLLGKELCLLSPFAKLSFPNPAFSVSSKSSSSTTASSVLTASLPLPFLTSPTFGSPELKLPLRNLPIPLNRPLEVCPAPWKAEVVAGVDETEAEG
jgi:hypothetical protein